MNNETFWTIFAAINMVIIMSYLVIMHYQQQKALNDIYIEVAEIRQMLKEDLETDLVADQECELLKHCLDFKLTNAGN